MAMKYKEILKHDHSKIRVQLVDTNSKLQAELDAHKADTNNPHSVTAEQLGGSNLLTEIKKVDGAGSGLDADLLDGKEASDFVQTSGDQTISGIKTFEDIIKCRFYEIVADGKPRLAGDNPLLQEMFMEEIYSNKIAFYDPSLLSFEYTTDGVNWIDDTVNISDSEKKKLLGGDSSAKIEIQNGVASYRITIRNDGYYVFVDRLYAYISTRGHKIKVHIWKKKDSGGWEQHTFDDTEVGAWPGHLYLQFEKIRWMATNPNLYQEIRIEFIPVWNPSYPNNNIELYKIGLWGSYPVGKRRVYKVDADKNVTFPASIFAEGGLKVWHEGNDGAGSGLDADLLDGKEASDFVENTGSSGYTHVYLSENKNVSAGTSYTIPFDTIYSDADNLFDTTNHRWVAPYDCLVFADLVVRLDNRYDFKGYAAIRKNGSEIVHIPISSYSGDGGQATNVFFINKDDYIDFLFNLTSGNVTLAGADKNFTSARIVIIRKL